MELDRSSFCFVNVYPTNFYLKKNSKIVWLRFNVSTITNKYFCGKLDELAPFRNLWNQYSRGKRTIQVKIIARYTFLVSIIKFIETICVSTLNDAIKLIQFWLQCICSVHSSLIKIEAFYLTTWSSKKPLQ